MSTLTGYELPYYDLDTCPLIREGVNVRLRQMKREKIAQQKAEIIALKKALRRIMRRLWHLPKDALALSRFLNDWLNKLLNSRDI